MMPGALQQHQALVLCVAVFVLCLTASAFAREAVSRHSFAGPFRFTYTIPNWDQGGHAFLTDTAMRLTPSMRDRLGYIWNNKPVEVDEWQVELEFRISNMNPNLPGGDGLAFWYAKQPKYGNLFGNAPDFEGIGVVFDTYDNDGQKDNPMVALIYGNGYDSGWSTAVDLKDRSISYCTVNFRNTASNVKARITLKDNTLTVETDITGTGDSYQLCFSTFAFLPRGYYFGLSAQTGGLSDYHDVYSFQAYDMTGEAAVPVESTKSTPTKKKKKRGYYNPYANAKKKVKATAQTAEQAKAQETTQTQTQTQTSTQSPPPEAPTQAYTESIDEVKKALNSQQYNQPAASQPAAAAAAATTTTTTTTTQDNTQNTQPATNNNQPQIDYSPRFEQLSSKFTNVMTEFEQLKTETGKISADMSLVMRALKVVVDGMKEAPSKNDIIQLASQLQALQSSHESSHSAISNVKSEVGRDLNQVTVSIKDENKKLSNTIKELEEHIVVLTNDLDNLAKQQGKFSKSMKQQATQLSSTIQSSTSYGFWIFFMLFELAFLAGLVFFFKFKEEKNKKLF